MGVATTYNAGRSIKYGSPCTVKIPLAIGRLVRHPYFARRALPGPAPAQYRPERVPQAKPVHCALFGQTPWQMYHEAAWR
jgi:hypothetical protein